TLVAPPIKEALGWFSFRARVLARRLAAVWADPARAHRWHQRSRLQLPARRESSPVRQDRPALLHSEETRFRFRGPLPYAALDSCRDSYLSAVLLRIPFPHTRSN